MIETIMLILMGIWLIAIPVAMFGFWYKCIVNPKFADKVIEWL